jgi:hypothetical protein
MGRRNADVAKPRASPEPFNEGRLDVVRESLLGPREQTNRILIVQAQVGTLHRLSVRDLTVRLHFSVGVIFAAFERSARDFQPDAENWTQSGVTSFKLCERCPYKHCNANRPSIV